MLDDINEALALTRESNLQVSKLFISLELEQKLKDQCLLVSCAIAHTINGIPYEVTTFLEGDDFKILGSDGVIYSPPEKQS